MKLEIKFPQINQIEENRYGFLMRDEIYILKGEEIEAFKNEIKFSMNYKSKQMEFLNKALDKASKYGLKASLLDIIWHDDFSKIQVLFNNEVWKEAYYNSVESPDVIPS